jgi:basic membrane lipoprotein Med (substrate-binding protein (PBP1-ABC) superfamily)
MSMASTRFFTSAALALLLSSGATHAAETVVGFIYVGPRDDYGYNQAHAQGAAAVAKLPDVKAWRRRRSRRPWRSKRLWRA